MVPFSGKTRWQNKGSGRSCFGCKMSVIVSFWLLNAWFGFLNIIISERDENTNTSVHKMNLIEEILKESTPVYLHINRRVKGDIIHFEKVVLRLQSSSPYESFIRLVF
jgi:hypothetical protein